MFTRYRLAEVAALLGDPARAGMVTALCDGTARPAGELARIAGVTPATASSHLSKLVGGGLLRVEQRGRHRYYRLASPQVAHALESLALLLPRKDDLAGARNEDLRRGRMCYDHLAGQLGVSLSDALRERKCLVLRDDSFALTPVGRRWFERFGISIEALAGGRRPLLRSCIDWTERREHLGGALGAALATHLLERDWLRRERGKRTVIVTAAGRSGLQRTFGIRG